MDDKTSESIQTILLNMNVCKMVLLNPDPAFADSAEISTISSYANHT